MIKNNFFVITGGPGAGKSSLLQYVNSEGFPCVAETGRKIIKERLLAGLPPRPAVEQFARQMFELDLNNFMSYAAHTSTIFFDRSFLDSALLISESNEVYFEAIKKTLKINRYNNRVFIAPPWEEIYRNDDERDQSFEEAIDTYERLCRWYEKNGYELVLLPKDSIEQRARFVFNNIRITG
jgi:predicted ATPase